MTSKRQNNLPPSWIRIAEAGHRLGLPLKRIGVWARLGYFRKYKRGQISYVCWDEMLRNKLVRERLAAFQRELENEVEKPRFKRKRHDPMLKEPMYKEG